MVVKSKGNPRLFQGNLGWCNIIIWPDIYIYTYIYIYLHLYSELIFAVLVKGGRYYTSPQKKRKYIVL